MRKISFGVLALMAAFALTLAAQSPQKAVDEFGKKVDPPKVLKKVTPKYPEAAKMEKVQGEVVLEATIDEKGKVVEAKASKSSDDRLSAAAIEALRQWEFQPAVNSKGKAVKVKMSVNMNFRLQ